MENDPNLMNFNQTICNISPNSRYMKPLISTISITSQQVRSVTDLSELSLDNNPFDEIFREVQLNNIDDPFEDVFKASLKTNYVEHINEMENQTDYADNKGEILENCRWDDASNNLDDVKLNSLITEHQSLVGLQEIDKSRGFKDQDSVISNDTFCSSESCIVLSCSCLNNEIRHIEYSSCVNGSGISNMDNLEGCRTKAKDVSSPIYADTDHKSMLQKCKSNSSSYKITGKTGIIIDNDTHSNNFDQTELDETIIDEAHAIANHIFQIDIEPTIITDNEERFVEDLVSIEPLWSKEFDDIDDDKEHFLSKQNNASSKNEGLLNDIKKVLENSGVNEVDLHDILYNMSTLCNSLKLNSEDNIISKHKNVDDQVSFIENRSYLKNKNNCVQNTKKIQNIDYFEITEDV